VQLPTTHDTERISAGNGAATKCGDLASRHAMNLPSAAQTWTVTQEMSVNPGRLMSVKVKVSVRHGPPLVR
jgi:hypothetical protein